MESNLDSKCLDQAIRFLSRREYSRAELRTKLRRTHPVEIIDAVLDELQHRRLLDDQRYAAEYARMAATRKKVTPHRALADLLRNGVSRQTAESAVQSVYGSADTPALARQLAAKHLPRLRNLPSAVARRRLAGVLARRGFDQDVVASLMDELLPS